MNEPYSRVLTMPWVEVMEILVEGRELRAVDAADVLVGFQQLFSQGG